MFDNVLQELNGKTIEKVTLKPYHKDQQWPQQLRIETADGWVGLFSVEGAVVRRLDEWALCSTSS